MNIDSGVGNMSQGIKRKGSTTSNSTEKKKVRKKRSKKVTSESKVEPMDVDVVKESNLTEMNDQKRLDLNNQNLGNYVYSSMSRLKPTEVINLDD